MTLKKVIGRLHLWLGLGSGLVVFIIAITGCIYAFQEEIQNITQPYRYVERRLQPFLPPSQLRKIADAQLPGKIIHGIVYYNQNRAAKAIYFKDTDYYFLVYINPYTGEVLKVKNEQKDFFYITLQGHFYLWLPHKTGQTVCASATLIFVVILLSGLFLWWPKNKGSIKQRFTIKWNSRWRRINHDLHSVLGFYAFSIALILALSGLVFGFNWFKKSVYKAAGGNKSLEFTYPACMHSLPAESPNLQAVDRVWEKVINEHPNAHAVEIHFPENSQMPVLAEIYPDPSTFYQTDYSYYDQHTLEELPVNHIWGKYANATAADKLLRMNYDIHTGAIWGLPGKILAFGASLIVASLPVTGFLIWYGRTRKTRSGSG